VPVYGVAAAWILYAIFFPLYKTHHFIILICLGVLAYVALSAVFRGTTEHVEIPEEPERSGDEKIDALLAEGEQAVKEIRQIRDMIPDEALRVKIDEIASVTDSIFKDLLTDPDDYPQVKRFATFYLPTTIKLLHTYDRFGKSGAEGEHTTGTMDRIDAALDTILVSYKRFFDSLFLNQALDIETDIRVLESMLKNDF